MGFEFCIIVIQPALFISNLGGLFKQESVL